MWRSVWAVGDAANSVQVIRREGEAFSTRLSLDAFRNWLAGGKQRSEVERAVGGEEGEASAGLSRGLGANKDFRRESITTEWR